MTDVLGSLLDEPPPPVGEGEAAELVGDVFGYAVRAEALTGERDRLFRVRGDVDAVLRVAHPSEDPRSLDLHAAVLEHLANVDPDLPTARTLRSRDGALAPRVTLAAGVTTRVRLSTWLPGTPWARAEGPTPSTAAVGHLLGRLDRALVGFDGPRDAVHPWNLALLLTDPARYAVAFEASPELRRPVLALRDRVDVAALPHQWIHNDANPHNLLVATSPPAVVGVIDVGDLAWAPRVQELAVAAAYLPGDPMTTLDELATAYESHLPLTTAEREALPLLVLGRCLLAALVSRYRAARHPENRDYLLRNLATTEATRAALSATLGR